MMCCIAWGAAGPAQPGPPAPASRVPLGASPITARAPNDDDTPVDMTLSYDGLAEHATAAFGAAAILFN